MLNRHLSLIALSACLAFALVGCKKKEKKQEEQKSAPKAAVMAPVKAKAAPKGAKVAKPAKAAKAVKAAKAPAAGKGLHAMLLGNWTIDGQASLDANPKMAKMPEAQKKAMVEAFGQMKVGVTKDKLTLTTPGKPAEVDTYVVKAQAGQLLTIEATDAKGKKETTTLLFKDDDTVLGTEITPKGPGMKMVLKRAK